MMMSLSFQVYMPVPFLGCIADLVKGAEGTLNLIALGRKAPKCQSPCNYGMT